MKPTIFIQIVILSIWNTCHAWVIRSTVSIIIFLIFYLNFLFLFQTLKRTFKIIVEDSSIELDERYVNVSIGISSDFKNESLLSMYITVFEDIDNLMVTRKFDLRKKNNSPISTIGSCFINCQNS